MLDDDGAAPQGEEAAPAQVRQMSNRRFLGDADHLGEISAGETEIQEHLASQALAEPPAEHEDHVRGSLAHVAARELRALVLALLQRLRQEVERRALEAGIALGEAVHVRAWKLANDSLYEDLRAMPVGLARHGRVEAEEIAGPRHR